jgi:hypothetical protein
VAGDVSRLAGLAEVSTLWLSGTAVTGWPLVTAGGTTFADADNQLPLTADASAGPRAIDGLTWRWGAGGAATARPRPPPPRLHAARV